MQLSKDWSRQKTKQNTESQATTQAVLAFCKQAACFRLWLTKISSLCLCAHLKKKKKKKVHLSCKCSRTPVFFCVALVLFCLPQTGTGKALFLNLRDHKYCVICLRLIKGLWFIYQTVQSLKNLKRWFAPYRSLGSSVWEPSHKCRTTNFIQASAFLAPMYLTAH